MPIIEGEKKWEHPDDVPGLENPPLKNPPRGKRCGLRHVTLVWQGTVLISSFASKRSYGGKTAWGSKFFVGLSFECLGMGFGLRLPEHAQWKNVQGFLIGPPWRLFGLSGLD